MGGRNFGLAVALGVAAGLIVKRSWRQHWSFRGKTVVVTGGSRGLGLVLAREFAAEGARVALLARDAEELARAEADLRRRGARVMSVACDLRNQQQVESAMKAIRAEMGSVDVLVNNAGVIQVGPFEQMTVKDFEDALAVHLFGPLHTSLAAIPMMREQGGGRIVNISSIGGKVAVPHLLPYTASKFALTGLSDGLRIELRKDNIFVTTVCPGLMRTGSPRNAIFKGKHELEYAWFAVSDSLPLLTIKVERAARKMVEACRRGDARLVITPQAKAAIVCNELFPEATTRLLALVNGCLPGPRPGSTETRSGWESQSRWAPSILTKLTDEAAARNNEIGSGSANGPLA